MAAPIPRMAGPLHALARLRRQVLVAWLRSRYTQHARLAALIAQQQQEAAIELMALQRSLRTTARQLLDLGALPPHLPDHIERGSQRCEP